MTDKEKAKLINELKESGNIISILDKVKNKLSFVEMLKLADDLSNKKKEIVYDYALNNYNVSVDDVSLILKNDNDRILLINTLLKYNYLNTAYYAMKSMDNPKSLSNDSLLRIINERDTVSLIREFNTLFIDELLDRKDYYNLIKYSDELPNDVIKKIYIKSFSSVRDYSYIIYMLSKDKRKEYTKVFLEEKCDNASIANHILKNKDYEKEDYERLLLIVVMFAKSDVIYDVLMRENLSDNQRKTLEKALLDTHDIEYIAYYYFFKDIEKFNLLFGSSLLFLSYVTLNKDKFKNKNILSKIKEKIKEENNNELSSKIEGNINTYIKKRRIK